MAVTAKELAARRRFNGKSASREYWLKAGPSDDEDDARDALLSTAPSSWEAGGTTLYLVADDCEVWEVGDNGPWYGIAQYAPIGAAQVEDDTSFEFDTGGGTQHLMASYSTVGAYGTNLDGAAAAVTDNGGLIGVVNGGVEGVDVPVGSLVFTVTRNKPISAMNASYLDILADMVGRINSGTFAGTSDDGVAFSYVAGEVMFFGARGGVRQNKAVISFTFGVSMNKTGLTVGEIAGIAKKGWEYMWVRYADTDVSKEAKAVYVEQVGLPGDFTTLAAI
jgi:hypothetical protein